MKVIISSLAGVSIFAFGSFALAQMGGSEMMDGEGHGHGYGMMGGHMGGWIAYTVIKVAVVLVGFWLLHRIAKAVEKIAASKA